MSRINYGVDAVKKIIQENLGYQPGHYFHVDMGIPGVHDGQVLLRISDSRTVLLDYGIHPTSEERAEAMKLPHVRILEGSGSEECRTPDCYKVGVPLVLYDSHPQETLNQSILFKTGKCFACAQASVTSRRHRLQECTVSRAQRERRAHEVEAKEAQMAMAGRLDRKRASMSESSTRSGSPPRHQKTRAISSPADASVNSVDGSTSIPRAAAAAKKKVGLTRVRAQRRGRAASASQDDRKPAPPDQPSEQSRVPMPRAVVAPAHKRLRRASPESGRDYVPRKPIPVQDSVVPEESSKPVQLVLDALQRHSDFEAPELRNHGQEIEFSLQPILHHLVCQYCHGIFREPFTMTGCLHTFCRSCILVAQAHKSYSCPICDVYLGQDITKFALPDRSLQDLIDKVIFPETHEQDLSAEAAFYESLGIERKVNEDSSPSSVRALAAKESQVKFELVPAVGVPALEYPLIETQGTIRISQLKRYIEMKLPDLGIKNATHDLEITCNGLPLGNELSVTFIIRTIWVKDDVGGCLTLTYRRREKSLEKRPPPKPEEIVVIDDDDNDNHTKEVNEENDILEEHEQEEANEDEDNFSADMA